MSVQKQIDAYIAAQKPAKRADLEALHKRILKLAPKSKLRFLDGRDSDGKVVTNENIGYGSLTLNPGKAAEREFYRIGLSANTSGVSVFVMGLEDRKFLPEAYGKRLGKAKVTGYCITFRHLKDVNLDVLEEIIARRLND